MTERILAAMSGGVDSSVAAALLVDRGFDVTGVTLRLWSCDDPSTESTCCNAESVQMARTVCDQLGIQHELLEGLSAFEGRVLRPSWLEYARGRTPNPCALCNRDVKMDLLLARADELGASRVATGHYARSTRSPTSLLRGRDAGKDQSYFLFGLSPGQLDRLLLPLGELTKRDVRDRARTLDLPNSERPDSQDACFAGGGEVFADALAMRFGGATTPGPMVDVEGREIGRHDGIHRFTIGQRRGLGISLGRPAYVVAIRAGRGEVVVSTNPDDLLSVGLTASGISWLAPPPWPTRVQAQVRYRHDAVEAVVARTGDDTISVVFDESQRAITPGQAVVLYDGERVLGGGWIEEAKVGDLRHDR